jgi:UDP-N-acetylmuramate dehydrogenase
LSCYLHAIMILRRDISLKPYNTFGIDVKAGYFVEMHSLEDLMACYRQDEVLPHPFLVIGGGSNILFTGDHEGTVLKIMTKGIEKVGEDDDHVWVRAQAGEVWDDVVRYCVERGYGKLENLSMIPGSAGGAPVQNIGAYGAELKDAFGELEAFDVETGTLRRFRHDECAFGYRDSIFKNALKDRCIILSVTFKLDKAPLFNTCYGRVEEELRAMGVSTLSLAAVREAVMRIRRSRLPDPADIGNAGSFFKNPVVPATVMQELKHHFPEMVAHENADGTFKIAAGWLIEACGWKGKKTGHVGVYPRQALVLVNYGGATGQEIAELAMKVKESVKGTFGIDLETEVNII